ncbi:MAG: hypothetical protein GY820_02840, partial [Gammaproteobacteria bacterium]|nr:hypothetical protein [Gammaproteobacteria bacterium]
MNVEKTVGVRRSSAVAPWHGVDAWDRCHDGAYLMGYHPHPMPYLAADLPPPPLSRFSPGPPPNPPPPAGARRKNWGEGTGQKFP